MLSCYLQRPELAPVARLPATQRPTQAAAQLASRRCIRAPICRAFSQQQQQQQQEPAAPTPPAAPRGLPPQLQPALAALASAAGAGLLQPSAALAAAQVAEAERGMYLTAVGLGTAGVVVTVIAGSRFMLSFYPTLEKKARARQLPWSLITSVDPALHWLQRGIFKMEPGDLNYGSVVLLAAVSSLLEALVGEGGLWLDKVPDPGVLHFLQYLVFFQNVWLLPTWAMVVLRFFCII